MTFSYPRTLSFAHPDYKVGCGETETPFIGVNGKTYLYVWNKIDKLYAYYCFEEDLFISPQDYEFQNGTHHGYSRVSFVNRPTS